MINAKPSEAQNNLHLNSQEVMLKLREIGQLRRAKMHLSCIIENIDDKRALALTLCRLLETSLILQTKNPNILAKLLLHSPNNILDEYQRLFLILESFDKHSALHTAVDKDSLVSGSRHK